MEPEQLKAVWSDYNQKLDKNLRLNQRIVRQINLEKVRSGMRTLIILRSVEALIFLAIVIGLWNFISLHFYLSAATISAVVLNVFATIGLAGSIGQIALITKTDYTGPVTSIQKHLAKIRSHNIQIFRLIILSTPFYLAYIFLGFELFFDIDLYASADHNWLIANIILSFCLTLPTLWLYKQLGPKAATRNWVKKLIINSGGKQTSDALEILDEVEKYEDEAE